MTAVDETGNPVVHFRKAIPGDRSAASSHREGPEGKSHLAGTVGHFSPASEGCSEREPLPGRREWCIAGYG